MALKYTALETIFTGLGTELNSLANGSAAVSSSPFSNDDAAERFPRAMVEINIATQGSNRTAGASVSLYVIPTTDGTNFGATTDECLDGHLAGVFPLDDGATTARILTGSIALPPADYHLALRNNTGQALAASGNTVELREYGYEDV